MGAQLAVIKTEATVTHPTSIKEKNPDKSLLKDHKRTQEKRATKNIYYTYIYVYPKELGK